MKPTNALSVGVGLLILLFSPFSLFSQSTDEYLLSSSGDRWATHKTGENDAIVNFRDQMVIWGTTIESTPNTSYVFLQCLPFPFNGFPGEIYGGIYDISGCGDGPGLSRFREMVLDEINEQLIVVCTYEGNDLGTNGQIVVFSIDVYTGGVNWSQSFSPYGDVPDIENVRITLDAKQNIAIAYSYAEDVSLPPLNLGIIKLSSNGNTLIFQNYQIPPGSALSFINVTDIFDDSGNGWYAIIGEINNGSPSASYLLQIDQSTGNLVNPFMYDYSTGPFPFSFDAITGDGSNYFITYSDFNNNRLTVGEIDPSSGFLNQAFEYPIPFFDTSVKPVDMDFNRFTSNLDLLLWYNDGTNNSFGLTNIDPYNNFSMNGYFKFDFVAGQTGGIPISYTYFENGSTTQNSQEWIVLNHPEGSVIPSGVGNDEIVGINILPLVCTVQDNDNLGDNPIGSTAASFRPLQAAIEGNTCDLQVDGPEDYSGVVYDCSGNPLGAFRRKSPLEEESSTTELVVEYFPNPVSDFLEVSVDSKEPIEIEFMDQFGRLVLTQRGQGKIDLRNLPSGNYFMNIHTDTQSTSKPLIIQR
jgi:hypothetical protein